MAEYCRFIYPGPYPAGIVVKNPPANAGDAKDADLIPGSGRSLKWQPTPVLLSGKFHDQKSQAGFSYMGIAELDTTERLSMSTRILKIDRLNECLHTGSVVSIPLSHLLSVPRLESQALPICRKLERV